MIRMVYRKRGRTALALAVIVLLAVFLAACAKDNSAIKADSAEQKAPATLAKPQQKADDTAQRPTAEGMIGHLDETGQWAVPPSEPTVSAPSAAARVEPTPAKVIPLPGGGYAMREDSEHYTLGTIGADGKLVIKSGVAGNPREGEGGQGK